MELGEEEEGGTRVEWMVVSTESEGLQHKVSSQPKQKVVLKLKVASIESEGSQLGGLHPEQKAVTSRWT